MAKEEGEPENRGKFLLTLLSKEKSASDYIRTLILFGFVCFFLIWNTEKNVEI